MSAKKPPSIYTALRIPPDLRAQAEERAKDDGRTLSNYIRFLIKQDLGLSVREEEGRYGSSNNRSKK